MSVCPFAGDKLNIRDTAMKTAIEGCGVVCASVEREAVMNREESEP